MTPNSASAVLSEKFVADRSRPVDFPDFTKDGWNTTPPLKLMGMQHVPRNDHCLTLRAVRVIKLLNELKP